MKTNFLYKFAMSLTVMLLAIVGAYMTTSMAKPTVLLDKMGYRFISAADPCHATKLCSTTNGVICKYGNIQLWARLNENDHQCVEVVYERQ